MDEANTVHVNDVKRGVHVDDGYGVQQTSANRVRVNNANRVHVNDPNRNAKSKCCGQRYYMYIN